MYQIILYTGASVGITMIHEFRLGKTQRKARLLFLAMII